MLNAVHPKRAKQLHLIARFYCVDIGVCAGLAAGLAAEVVGENLVALGWLVAARVLADVLPVGADLLAVDFEAVEGVVGCGRAYEGEEVGRWLHLVFN